MSDTSVRSGGRARLVVLVSGVGTLLGSLLDASADPGFPAEIVAVGADIADAGGLARANAAGVPTFVLSAQDFTDRSEWDSALADEIAGHSPDWVLCAGFMRILGAEVISRFPQRILNTHPALLPAFPGAHGVRDALAYGVKVTGCTVHLVDSGVDTGPIIAQAPVHVEPTDDEETLHERIKTVERSLLVGTIAAVAARGLVVSGRKALIP
ncbi:MAG: phosphoribosylglycinamide formyltransferase [Actinomycetes bacterium]